MTHSDRDSNNQAFVNLRKALEDADNTLSHYPTCPSHNHGPCDCIRNAVSAMLDEYFGSIGGEK